MEIYDFCSYPYGTEYTALVTRGDNDQYDYEYFESFDGMTVGTPKDYLLTDYFKEYEEEHKFNVKLKYYDTPELALEAVRNGEIDGAVCNLIEVKETDKVVARFEPKPFSQTNQLQIMVLKGF